MYCRPRRAIESKQAGLAVLNEAHDLLKKHGILLRPFRPKFSLLDRRSGRILGLRTQKRLPLL
ncbi:MAG: hypothetical protein ACOCZA_13085 [Spirochaetota bacterium]